MYLDKKEIALLLNAAGNRADAVKMVLERFKENDSKPKRPKAKNAAPEGAESVSETAETADPEAEEAEEG